MASCRGHGRPHEAEPLPRRRTGREQCGQPADRPGRPPRHGLQRHRGRLWHIAPATMSGSWQPHASTVLGAAPAEYYRLAETGTAQAVNQVNGSPATYSGVTLGVAGGPFDDPAVSTDDTTVASFNGTS